MHIRRIRTQAGHRHEVLGGSGWEETAERPELGGLVYDAGWELEKAGSRPATTAAELPFQPLSFRDFMLYERHSVDASRGYARRFLPRLERVGRAYERYTGRTFPPYKPAALFHQQPIYYMGNHLTFLPSGSPVTAPAYSQALDYELELGFVLSRPLLDATPATALEAIGAFVVVNDLSARDVQRAEMRSGLGPQRSKHFASSMSGHAVTADEVIDRVDDIRGSVEINGETVAATSTAGMRWSLGEVLAHVSRSEPLFPGELFATGTLPGGCALENGHWLERGDRLVLRIEGVGEIEHQIL